MIFGVEQRIYLSGIKTNDLQINMPALYQLSYIKPLFWRSPYLVNILSSDVRNIPAIAEIKVDNP